MSLASFGDRAPVIVAYARTAFGKLNGALKSMSAPQLGAVAMKGAIARANIDKDFIDEVIFGNVLSSGIGQAPATQAVIFAGLGEKIPSTTINKVCSSGMKSIAFGATSIALGLRECVLCGGMESMTKAPHLLQNVRSSGLRLGDTKLIDSMIHDGLWDPYQNVHMGICAEIIAQEMNFSRAAQDEYAAMSYDRAHKSIQFAARDIVPVDLPTRRGQSPPPPLLEDEEPKHSSTLEELAALKPAFKSKDGTVTAGNASTINDGAAALIVTSRKFAREHNLTPLCDILAIADAQTEPTHFTIAPALAIPLALEAANLDITQIERFEINGPFAVAAMANAKLLHIPYDRLNVHGGAVAIGHPIGTSGARLVGSLAADIASGEIQSAVAAICNGGGGASAMVLSSSS